MNYQDFLERKSQLGQFDGFEPIALPDGLFDFQRYMTELAIRKGRFAALEDCGLGKTFQELVWADNVVRHTNKPVLINTPLAVVSQTLREAEKFGIEAHRSNDGKNPKGIVVSNYEKLHFFDPADYAGFVCDEAGILKSFDGVRRQQITDFMRKLRYRLLGTATPAPNDYIELGTLSEALGELGYTDMLTRFFKNDQNTIKPMRYTGYGAPRGSQPEDQRTDKWRFKGHAEIPFWRWVSSWARAVRKPSDIGFSDEGFELPPLIERSHVVDVERPRAGMLFNMPAVGLKEQRAERRHSIQDRCEKAASLVADTGKPAILWCHLNDEGDLLEEMVKGSVQVSGKDSDEAKEEKFEAFVKGEYLKLVTKKKIGGWGMNFQHCAHMTSFPDHSYEGYYQTVRRCHRFGQKQSVVSDIITTEGDKNILANMQRKALAADKMFSALAQHMHQGASIRRTNEMRNSQDVPLWLEEKENECV